MEVIHIQKNATQLKKGSTPKLKQARPHFPGSYLVKWFFPGAQRVSEILALAVPSRALLSVQPRASG